MTTSTISELRNSGSRRLPGGGCVVRPEELPWTPWALNGVYFKLLSVNRSTGMWAVAMKIDPDTRTDIHYHYGDAHIYVTAGGYSYEHDRVNAGDYNIECGSVAHEPIIGSDGQESFTIFYGGITSGSADGNPSGEFVDVEWMYKAAKANNAADHLLPPPPPREAFAQH